jgi:hypothetical protein
MTNSLISGGANCAGSVVGSYDNNKVSGANNCVPAASPPGDSDGEL